ncbi:MAG: M48 family metalloprotease [Deltaproteobacteria bacterium]|jgi:predicted Zn-dependent protease|nr:M48 family metalloprotease [Deltaproteobacteria bacterium]
MKYLLFILTVGCLTAACATHQPVSIDQALMAGDDEQILWRQAQAEQRVLDGSGWLYRDAELETYLNTVAARLGASADSPDIIFNIKVINDPNLNAFAFPNGVIYVHTGVLARMENEAQLAALLAHEMAHCICRHSLRVLKSMNSRPRYMAAVQQAVGRIGMARELARLLGVNGSMAAVDGYTRELEAEADRVGLDLMAKAGYDSRQALNLFEHLQQEIKDEDIKEPFFFGTHPSVQQRIENARRWLGTASSAQDGGLVRSGIFRSKLDRLILDNADLDLRIGRFEIARRSVQTYLDRHPNDAGAHYMLGEIFRQRDGREDTAKAVQQYEKAIGLDPSFPDPHKAMGLIHYKVGEQQLARKYFETCLLLAPEAPDKAYIEGYLRECLKNGEES